MSELPGGVPPASVPEPRESALGIVVRTAGRRGVEVLLGRRSRTSRFLPGSLAFPGGRLEPQDEPGRPGAHARCAARELAEETGLTLTPEELHEAGVRITPPLFPRRFRTEFFVAQAPDGADIESTPSNPENEWVGFLEPDDVLDRWAGGRESLPPPVVAALRAIRDSTADGSDAEVIAQRVRAANADEERAPRIEFVPDVWMVPVRTLTLPPATHTNAWIPGGARFVVFDPGTEAPDELDALDRVLQRRMASGCRPEAVVLTHHHRDHVSGAAPLAERLGVPVMAHADVLRRMTDRLGSVETRAIAPDDVIDLDGLTLRAVLTEGHAPGHLAFVIDERRAIISGDLVSALSTMLIDPDDGSMDDYLASLDRLAATDAAVLFPAHGPPLPIKALARVRDHRLDRERRILEVLSTGEAALGELAARAYADTPDAPAFLRERQTLAHLIRLERLGTVHRKEDCWRSDG